jgi:hypothetical protein
MDPMLILFAIRAAVRLSRGASDAFGQYARDHEILLPAVRTIEFPVADRIRFTFETEPQLLREQARPYWNSFTKKGPQLAGDMDVLAAEFALIQAQRMAELKDRAPEATGYWMVAQWSKKDAPAGPFARIVLALVDVAAEYAAVNPGLFGIGGQGEILVQALARNVADLIPDDTQPLGPRNLFGERLGAIFLKAGLAALHEHPDAWIEEEHLQLLVKNTLPKLIDKLPDDGLSHLHWRDVIEDLLQPVAQAAVEAAAAHPEAFFGKKFAHDDLLGALTRSFLLKVADIGSGEIFTRSSAVELYKSIVGLAAARPELFLGDTSGKADKFIAAVFADLAGVMEASAPPFDEATISGLAAVALDTLRRENRVLSDDDQSWHDLVAAMLTPVLAALSEAVATHNTGALRVLVSGPQLTDFVRTVLTQIAKTPGMMVTTEKPEINALVSAIALAMAKDDQLLLNGDDWLKIVAVAAEEVAANPGRLIGLDGGNPAEDLLLKILTGLLSAASAQWRQGQRARSVLFGPTLRDSIIIAIRVAASNAAAARLNAGALEQLAVALTTFIAANPLKYGSKEWLRLYRQSIIQAVHDGVVAQLDAALADAALAGGVR